MALAAYCIDEQTASHAQRTRQRALRCGARAHLAALALFFWHAHYRFTAARKGRLGVRRRFCCCHT